MSGLSVCPFAYFYVSQLLSPMHGTMQGGLTTFALLFKAQINAGKYSIGVDGIVNSKPA